MPRRRTDEYSNPESKRVARSTNAIAATAAQNPRSQLNQTDSTSNGTSISRLTTLIEQNAPLSHQSSLVLMYGPFQAEMPSSDRQGVGSWIRHCLHQHGLPSLIRFDYRRRAQVLRRDQFQPWLEGLINQVPG